MAWAYFIRSQSSKKSHSETTQKMFVPVISLDTSQLPLDMRVSSRQHHERMLEATLICQADV